MQADFASQPESAQHAPASSGTGGDENKPKTSGSATVRRRNRMITSCLECRRRKLRCDKQSPCTNCSKFSRECTFLAPALDSVSQQKLNEIKDRMGSLEKVLEEDVAKRGQGKAASKKERKTSIDLPGEASDSDTDELVPEDEKGLEPTPLAVVDASYEDDANDDVLDLGIRIGKMRMTERLGGFIRPKMSEELSVALENPYIDDRTEIEKVSGIPPLGDNASDFLEPGPSYIAPSSGVLFGDTGSRRNLIDFLPTKAAGDALVAKYRENVHFVARVVHWPQFQLHYENFWTSILSGVEPPPSQQALIFAIFFSAVASMSEVELTPLFGQQKQVVVANFQMGTEVGLSKAQFLRTTKIETLQALVAYLIPMCRDQMSRAHSVLVGTAIRLAECMGLHRDPADVYALPPVECHIRRILWFQLGYLDFRTGEVQGPRPCIKREDYDTKFPMNIDDVDVMSGKPESNTRFTDMTLSRIRFECSEMHRIVWYDRLRLEKKKITLTHVLGKIEGFRKAMEAKYAPILDISVPVQRYAHLVMTVLLYRMHIMVLHRYHNNHSKNTPERLRQIIVTTGIKQLEAAVKLETSPDLVPWKWYNGTYQQWHAAFLLLFEIYTFPDRREAGSIWDVIDFVFETDKTLSRTQRARTIISAVKDRIGVYRDIRRMRAPLSMRMDDVRRVWERQLSATSPSPPAPTKAKTIAKQGDNAVQQAPSQSAATDTPKNEALNASWSFDGPATYLFQKGRNYRNPTQVPGWGQKQQGQFDTTPYQALAGPQLEYSSPSDSSTANEAWPPYINNAQNGWRLAQAMNPQGPRGSISLAEGANAPYSPPTLGQGGPLPTTVSNMPFSGHTPSSEDSAMADIDWSEWDKLFPPEQNVASLDMSHLSHRKSL